MQKIGLRIAAQPLELPRLMTITAAAFLTLVLSDLFTSLLLNRRHSFSNKARAVEARLGTTSVQLRRTSIHAYGNNVNLKLRNH